MSEPQEDFPQVPLLALDTLWLQVAGTICNLRCAHCFISCAPDNHSHGMMSLADVEARLQEAVALGVKDYYLTGGEPLMNREIFDILRAILRVGPATVLTNGLLIDTGRASRLRELAEGSRYSLDLRISLDGYDAASHDAIRGPGTWERAVEGARRLVAAGFDPVITVTEVDPRIGCSEARGRFLEEMRALGLPRPRLKVLSAFHIGREERRSRPYGTCESLRGVALRPDQIEALQCSTSRMVTSRGVYVCPILIDRDGARMGRTLQEALGPFPLDHGACHTCHATGVTCRT